MKPRTTSTLVLVALALASADAVVPSSVVSGFSRTGWVSGQTSSEAYLTWSASQAEAVGKSTYSRGRVGSVFGWRGLKTERASNYKLAATWLTPDVIRATARLAQLTSRLTEEQTRALVQEAEATGDTVVMVEIDPTEGSGVIPRDWEAFLLPKGANENSPRVVKGTNNPKLYDVRALAGVLRRNYDYDRFWVVFPLTAQNGEALFANSDREAELIVRIYDKEGRVDWPIPESIRSRASAMATKKPSG